MYCRASGLTKSDINKESDILVIILIFMSVLFNGMTSTICSDRKRSSARTHCRTLFRNPPGAVGDWNGAVGS